MKKIKLNASKLQLNKEKISNLTNTEMGRVVGGAPGGPGTLYPDASCFPCNEISDCFCTADPNGCIIDPGGSNPCLHTVEDCQATTPENLACQTNPSACVVCYPTTGTGSYVAGC